MGTHNFFSNGGVEAKGIWCRVYQLSPRSGDEVRKVPVGIQVYAPCAPWRTGSSYSPFFNTPPLVKSEVEYYSMLAKTDVHHYSGTNNDLGAACGQYYRVSMMAVVDPGDSDILESIPNEA